MPHAFGQQLLVKPLADCVRRYPRVNVDLQGELAIMVGATVRNVDETHALSCIGGYTNFNDGSVRDFQKHSLTAGKNFDSSGACGPWVVTSDVIPDPTKLKTVHSTQWGRGAEFRYRQTDLQHPIHHFVLEQAHRASSRGLDCHGYTCWSRIS